MKWNRFPTKSKCYQCIGIFLAKYFFIRNESSNALRYAIDITKIKVDPHMGGKFEKRKATAFIISHLPCEKNLHLVGAHCCGKPLIVCMDMVTTVIFIYIYIYNLSMLIILIHCPTQMTLYFDSSFFPTISLLFSCERISADKFS